MLRGFGLCTVAGERYVHVVIRAKTFCWRAWQQCYSGLVTVKMDIPLIDAFPGPAKQTSRLSGIVYMQSLTT